MTRQVVQKYTALIFGCMIMLVAITLMSQEAKNEIAAERRLFDLDATESSITAIEISRGDARVAMVRTNSVWQIDHHEQLKGYPVDPLAMARLIRFVLAANYLEKKTNRPEKLQKLGLGLAVDQSDAAGPVLLSVNMMSKVTRVLIGDLSQSGQGTYIRLPNENQVWLVSEQLELPVDVLAWVPPVFLNVDRAEIKRVTFTSPLGEKVVVSGSDETESAVIENMPRDAKLAYDSTPDSAMRALVNLRMLEVRRADHHSWDSAATARFELTSGSVILLRCAEINGSYWLLVDRDGLTDRWSYAVDQYRFTQLTKEMRDYLALK